MYSANALAEQVRQAREGSAPYSFTWALSALPHNFVICTVVMRGFSFFVTARVAIMRRRQFAYNGQGIRHDGNCKLARVLTKSVEDGRCTVVLALCGVDGSLLDVPVPMPSESDIESVLRPMLLELMGVSQVQ